MFQFYPFLYMFKKYEFTDFIGRLNIEILAISGSRIWKEEIKGDTLKSMGGEATEFQILTRLE